MKTLSKIFICLIILGIINNSLLVGPMIIIYIFILIMRSISKNVNHTSPTLSNSLPTGGTEKSAGVILKCAKCNSVMTVNHKFCTNCGASFSGDNVKVEMDPNAKVVIPGQTTSTAQTIQQTSRITPSNFDSMFSLSEEAMVNEFINRELIKAGIDKNTNLIPSDILKRRKILNIIFSVLVFLLVSLIFFHFPIFTYIAGIVILLCAYKLTNMYNFMSYLKKQLKARPSEKVSNIVMSVKESFVPDTSKKVLLPGILIAIILPLIIFINPIILYEKTDGGYAVRYYIFGVTNFTKATIPEKHNNENIVSLRGNTFSNMPFLNEVTLPDTITEIRGQAFKNDKSLKTVKLPSNLNYLGGGAFYNCTSLESIEIPDSVTYMGGETFYKARKLKSVKLSNNLTEIRGNTFEYCTSLKSIEIPDSVTRIGGHAFYGNSSLSSVYISENSKLTEIGSSAFRMCSSLYEIVIPKGVSVNYRAFKESPTDVKEYGDFDVSNSSNSSYNYESSIYMHVGETKEINQYRKSALLQDAYITLVSVNKVNGVNEFNLKYNDSYSEIEFTLTQQNSYKIINQNLVIEISGNYVFETYDDKVSFYAYYN